MKRSILIAQPVVLLLLACQRTASLPPAPSRPPRAVSASVCSQATQHVLVNETPAPPARLAGQLWHLRTAGASNELLHSVQQALQSGTNAAHVLEFLSYTSTEPPETARLWRATDIAIADAVCSAAPSNLPLLCAAARIYTQHALHADAMHYYQRIVTEASDPVMRATAAAAWGSLLFNNGNVTGAYALAPLVAAAALSSNPLAYTAARWQLAAGASNDAYALLMNICTSAPPFNDIALPLTLLLQSEWPDPAWRHTALDAVIASLERVPPQYRTRLPHEVTRCVQHTLICLNRPEQSFALAYHGIGDISALCDACVKPGWSEHARRLVAHVCASQLWTETTWQSMHDLACACALPTQALQCILYGLTFTNNASRSVFMDGLHGLSLARSFHDAAACTALVSSLDSLILSADDPADLLQGLCYHVADSIHSADYQRWFTLAWRAHTNAPSASLASSLIAFATQNGLSNLVREVLSSHASASNLSVDMRIEHLHALSFLGETGASARALASLMPSFTNSAVIASHGAALLRALQSTGAASLLATLLPAWCTNSAIPFHLRADMAVQASSLSYAVRTQLLNHLFFVAPPGEARCFILHNLLDTISYSTDPHGFARLTEHIANLDSLSFNERSALAQCYMHKNMPHLALVQYESLLAGDELDDFTRSSLLHDLTAVCASLDRADDMLAYARDALAADDPAHRCLSAISLAETMGAHGYSSHARSMLSDLLATHLSPLETYNVARVLINLSATTDPSFDVHRAAQRLRELDASPEGQGHAAMLLAKYGAYDAARNHVQLAIANSSDPEFQRALYSHLATIAHETDHWGDEADALMAHFALLPASDRPSHADALCCVLAQCGRDADIIACAIPLLADSSAALSPSDRNALHRQLADAYFRLGNHDAAWSAALSLDDATDFYDIAATLHRTADAREHLQELLARASDDSFLPTAHALMSVYETAGDVPAMQALAAQAAARTSSPYEACHIAELCERSGLLALAHQVLERALPPPDSPLHAVISRALLALYQRQGRFDDAHAWLASLPDSSSRRSLQASLFSAQGNFSAAVDTLCTALTAPDAPASSARLPSALLDTLRAANDPRLIEYTATQLDQHADLFDPSTCADIALMYKSLDCLPHAIAWLERAQRSESSSQQKTVFATQLCECYAAHGDWDRVVLSASHLLSQPFPSWEQRDCLYDHLAHAYSACGNIAEATRTRRAHIAACEAAARSSSNNGSTRLRLAQLYLANGQSDQAKSLLLQLSQNYRQTWIGSSAEHLLQDMH